MEGKTNYSQVYILMTILLILSQDEVNNDAIQKIVSCSLERGEVPLANNNNNNNK